MQALSGKQKRYLRSLGQRLPVAATVGKGGLSASALAHLQRVLVEHELLKVRIGEEYVGADRKEAAAELEQAVGASCVGIVGRTVLLYRPNENLDAKQRITLPG